MKKVKLVGKLKLNKEIISNLSHSEMKNVKGGLGKTDNYFSWGKFCTIAPHCGIFKETQGAFCER